MRIEFDAGSDTELTAVFVMLAVLRGGDLSLPLLGDDQDIRITGQSDFVPPVPPAAPAPVPAPPAAVPAPPVAAVPAPPVPAPPAVPAAPAAPAAGVDTDKAGLPWDARIHSKPPSKKKDGYWRQKRGVDEATVASVTAELQQAMAAPPAAPTVANGAPPAVGMDQALEQSRAHLGGGAPAAPLPPAEPVADAATAFGAGGAAAASEPAPPAAVPAPPVAAAPAPPAAGAAPAGSTFADLMRKITTLQTAGTLTVEGTQQIAQSLGITGVRDLMHRPDLIPAFDALLPVAA